MSIPWAFPIAHMNTSIQSIIDMENFYISFPLLRFLDCFIHGMMRKQITNHHLILMRLTTTKFIPTLEAASTTNPVIELDSVRIAMEI